MPPWCTRSRPSAPWSPSPNFVTLPTGGYPAGRLQRRHSGGWAQGKSGRRRSPTAAKPSCASGPRKPIISRAGDSPDTGALVIIHYLSTRFVHWTAVPPLLDGGGVVGGHLLHHGQVPSGRECGSRASDHRDGHRVVGVHDRPDLRELPMQALVGRIQRLGPIDGDEEDRIGRSAEGEMLVVGVVGKANGARVIGRVPIIAPSTDGAARVRPATGRDGVARPRPAGHRAWRGRRCSRTVPALPARCRHRAGAPPRGTA